MHKFRSAARHSAWKQDGANFNPFCRIPSKQPRPSDVEEGLVPDRPRSTHSENCARDLEQEQQDGPSEPHPKRSETVPSTSEPGSATSQHPPLAAFENAQKRVDNEKTEPGEPLANGNSNEGLKQRKSRPGIPQALSFRAFGKRRKDDHLYKTESELEKEEKTKKFNKKIPFGTQLKAVLYPQWLTINWLLLLVPVGIAVAQVDSIPPIAVFVINFLAIIPLAGMLSYATEEIALRVGETLGGLLNASFGNAVELIVGIIALVKREVIIVQTSLIGSMLSNLLLVLGMCFFFGGINRLEQNFNMVVAQTAASMLALSFGCLIIPTAFTWGVGGANKSNRDEKLSRGTAIIMLFVYGCYLFFQLKSHKDIYNAPSAKVEKRKGAKKEEGETIAALAGAGAGQAAHAGGQINRGKIVHEPEEEEEEPQLSLIGALVTLAGSTTLVGVCAEFLVDSINDVTCQYGVSQYFVGLILLPIVGNAAEHATAVTVAIKDKMDLAIGVAVGSSMQIALLVLPLMIVLGWIMGGRDLTLVFDDFQIAVLFVAVLLVNYLISDGKSHWMEGILLMTLYIIIAVASWFYPTPEDENQCGS